MALSLCFPALCRLPVPVCSSRRAGFNQDIELMVAPPRSAHPRAPGTQACVLSTVTASALLARCPGFWRLTPTRISNRSGTSIRSWCHTPRANCVGEAFDVPFRELTCTSRALECGSTNKPPRCDLCAEVQQTCIRPLGLGCVIDNQLHNSRGQLTLRCHPDAGRSASPRGRRAGADDDLKSALCQNASRHRGEKTMRVWARYHGWP